MAEFFYMGGHAVFVWSSYAITFIVMLSIFLWPLFEKKAIKQTLKKAELRKQQLAKRKSLATEEQT